MDSKKLISSRNGHKAHQFKLLTGAEEILARLSQTQESKPDLKLTPSDAVLLDDLLKQLRSKATIFEELDEKIIDATDDEKKVEDLVFESADLQSSLSAKVALISHTLATNSPLESPVATEHTDAETETTVLPPSNSSTDGSRKGGPHAKQTSDVQTDTLVLLIVK